MAELETVARPYAEALFMIAKENPKAADGWSDFLRSLKEAMQTAEVPKVMGLPDLSFTEKKRFLSELSAQALKRDLTSAEENFLHVISENGRYDLLPMVNDQFQTRLLEERNILKVEMQSAYALTDGQEEMFIKALKKRFDKEIELTVTISPSLLGGAILKIDDLVIDGSILGRLNNMIRSMN